ncbi:hypothetical protein BFF78_29840 [Streptomyces fodineus]|uniref:Uncharacterized protein n=1 Tax=Streptomyces fodineus TaxID=1904616 RepID=A0A1D7YGK4_9ACTN|nr:hypothetical protein [Streptomyces fodineus]AOR34691.1 hypothetical protein BFF78_29840 [Streptomyces fodineus]
MANARRELPGAARLVLDIEDRPGPPQLRFEATGNGRLTAIRQGERPVLLGALTGDGCCHDLHLHRLDGYRSPLPPIESARMRSEVNWVHQYARWLEASGQGPWYDGRWELSPRTVFEPAVWTADFVRDWPGGLLELYCGGGWHGILPLRRLCEPDAARVKAYRKHVRDGTLAPVLLWWAPSLDGWLILDGHDRAVAALAEGRTPPCVVLTRLRDEELWRRDAEEMTEGHRRRMERLAARPATPGTERQRAAMEQGYGRALADLPYEPSGIRTWPLPGGAPAWRALARAAMFQFPGD